MSIFSSQETDAMGTTTSRLKDAFTPTGAEWQVEAVEADRDGNLALQLAEIGEDGIDKYIYQEDGTVLAIDEDGNEISISEDDDPELVEAVRQAHEHVSAGLQTQKPTLNFENADLDKISLVDEFGQSIDSPEL